MWEYSQVAFRRSWGLVEEVVVETSLQRIGWAMKRYGASRDSVYSWARAGRIPSVRVGRSVLFDPAITEAFIADGGQDPEPTSEEVRAALARYDAEHGVRK